jgi:predicted nucleic acid-binding protein
MTTGVFLDTSYLISLVDQNRKNHAAAADYYRYMLGNNVRMFVSAIAASEFAVRQPIGDLPLKNFTFVPFNVPHGVEAARLWTELRRDAGDDRAVVRDDVKLMAQAEREGISFILTDDKNTMYKHCERLRIADVIKLRAVKLEDGFDNCAFRTDGQIGLKLSHGG